MRYLSQSKPMADSLVAELEPGWRDIDAYLDAMLASMLRDEPDADA